MLKNLKDLEASLPKLDDMLNPGKPRIVRRPSHEINANLMATGPRTPEGKAISSMNSLKHGLTSKKVILPGEDQAEFDQLHDRLVSEYRPEGTVEFELVSEIAACFWRLHRARAYESNALDGKGSELFFGFGSASPGSGFDRLLRYMGAIERQLNRTLIRLQQLQQDRRRQALPEKPRTMTASATQPATSGPDQFVLSTAQTSPQPTAEFVSLKPKSAAELPLATQEPAQPIL